MKKLLQKLFLIFSFVFCQFIFTVDVHAESLYSLIVNEVMPNPTGSDTEFEWIELYNFGNTPLQLSDFKLDEVALPPTLLESKQYIIIARNPVSILERYEVDSIASHFSLSNTADTVQIKTIEGTLVDSVSYTSSSEEKSLERKGNKNTPECMELVEHTTDSSINEKNENYTDSCNEFPDPVDPIDPEPPVEPEEPQEPEEPEVLVTISSIEFSTDQLNWRKELTLTQPTSVFFRYTLSDPSVTIINDVFALSSEELTSPHTFNYGNYTLLLTITLSDGAEITATSDLLQIIQQKIIITEIYPSPLTSTGENEWIEIYNYGDSPVSLKGWYVKDKGTQADGFGSTKGFFPEVTIDSNSHYIFSQPALKVSLNNSGDTVGIFNMNNELIDTQEYANTPNGQSFSLPYSTSYANSDLQLTQTPTPNAYSIIFIAPEESEELEEDQPVEEIPEEIIPEITIKQAKTSIDDSKVKISGCSSVETNLLSQRTTYLQDETSGVQLSNLDDLFTENQKIEVVGVMDTAYKARKLIVSEVNIMGNCTVSAQQFSADKRNEQEGMMVQVTGIVSKKFQNGFDVIDENKNTIRITIKELTGISLTDIQKDKKVNVAGIITKYNDSFRILPREQSDIIVFDDEIEETELEDTSISNTSSSIQTKANTAKKISISNTVNNSAKVLGAEAVNYRLPGLSPSLLNQYEKEEPLPLLLPVLIIIALVILGSYLFIIRIDKKLVEALKMLFPPAQTPTNYFARKVTN